MDKEPKLNDFEAASYDDWYKLVERDLKGAPFEKKLVKQASGVRIKPLYLRSDVPPEAEGELPGFAPYTRGGYALGAAEMGWDVRGEVRHADPAQAAQAVLGHLNGGARSIALVCNAGEANSEREAIAVADLAALGVVLSHVDLEKTPLSLTAGAEGYALAAGLLALAEQRKARTSALSGCLGLDPIGQLARDGELGASLARALDRVAEIARWAASEAPNLRAVSVDTSAYHEAGADAATEIAVALASGVTYLRALTERGLGADAALAQLAFGFSVGRDFFVEIAKLRAARRCWARVVSVVSEGKLEAPMLIAASTSLREITQRDPWVNLLRGTAESFAAAVGGADAITTHGFDAALGASDDFAERMARNTQHLLRDESNLHRVVDPAGGSFYVESLTHALCDKAWSLFQGLEKSGGLTQALSAGSLQESLKRALEQDERAVETRKIAITGVNEFPHVGEDKVVRQKGRLPEKKVTPGASKLLDALSKASDPLRAAIAALTKGARFADVQRALEKGEQPAKVPALLRRRLAAPLEALRDRADAHLASRGHRPRVFLANLGPVAEHKARAMFAQNFFEAGGFEVLGNDGFTTPAEAAAAFQKSGAELCAICSSDALYAELAADAAERLGKAAAKAVVLAGNPGEREATYRAAGVTDFIFMGQNLVTTLSSLLTRAGVK